MMKHLKLLSALLSLVLPVMVSGQAYVTTTDYLSVSAQVADSSAYAWNTADSVHVRVTFKGSECINAWYHAGDAQADSAGGVLTFFDQYADLDADSGNGMYQVRLGFYDASLGLYEYKDRWFVLGPQGVNVDRISGDVAAADNLEAILDGTGAALDVTTLAVDSSNNRKVVIGGENDDQASLYVYNTGTAPAGKFNGTGGSGSSGLFLHSDSSFGLFAQTEGRSRIGQQWAYAGFGADNKGLYGFGAKFSQSSEDTSCVGAGLWMMSAGAGDAWKISAGMPGDTLPGHIPRNNFALQAEGPWSLYTREGSDHTYNETLWQLHGKRQSVAWYAYSDSALYTARLSGGITSTGLLISGGSSSGSDVLIGAGGNGEIEGFITVADTTRSGWTLALLPHLDTLGALSGALFGSTSKYNQNTDVDSLAVIMPGGVDTVAWLLRHHPGRGGGVWPDSTATPDGPGR